MTVPHVAARAQTPAEGVAARSTETEPQARARDAVPLTIEMLCTCAVTDLGAHGDTRAGTGRRLQVHWLLSHDEPVVCECGQLAPRRSFRVTAPAEPLTLMDIV